MIGSETRRDRGDAGQIGGERQEGRERVQDPGLQHADEGTGPLLERDYTVVIHGSRWEPERVAEAVRADFPSFSPADLARFVLTMEERRPLRVDDVMDIYLPLIGRVQVQVSDVDARSLTLRTVDGHPEAGRISFGASRNEAGELVFRIRSRARMGTWQYLLAYLSGGICLQTAVWRTFLQRVAERSGGQAERVRIRTRHTEESHADRGHVEAPTFRAQDREPVSGGV